MSKVVPLFAHAESPVLDPEIPRVYMGLRDLEAEGVRTKVYVARMAPGWRPKLVPLAHSSRTVPDDFEWGYCGAGPTELARALLKDHFGGPNPASELVYAFRDDVIAYLPQDEQPWTMASSAITRWLSQYLAARPTVPLFEIRR